MPKSMLVVSKRRQTTGFVNPCSSPTYKQHKQLIRQRKNVDNSKNLEIRTAASNANRLKKKLLKNNTINFLKYFNMQTPQATNVITQALLTVLRTGTHWDQHNRCQYFQNAVKRQYLLIPAPFHRAFHCLQTPLINNICWFPMYSNDHILQTANPLTQGW